MEFKNDTRLKENTHLLVSNLYSSDGKVKGDIGLIEYLNSQEYVPKK